MAERRARTRTKPSVSDAGRPAVAAPEPSPAADAQLALIERSFRPLSDDEREALRSSLALAHQANAALYAYPLTNADEPDVGFAAYRVE